jgi:hypothetical protein
MAMRIPSIGYLLLREDFADEGIAIDLSRGSTRIAAEDLPNGWTNKWSRLDKWQGFPEVTAWCLKHYWNCLGHPELLLYSQHNEESTIF